MTTVAVIHFPEIVAKIGVPRAVHVRFPLGRTFGPAGRADLQLRILRDALLETERATEPNQIRTLPYRWRRD